MPFAGRGEFTERLSGLARGGHRVGRGALWGVYESWGAQATWGTAKPAVGLGKPAPGDTADRYQTIWAWLLRDMALRRGLPD
jgi:hypothetical protein